MIGTLWIEEDPAEAARVERIAGLPEGFRARIVQLRPGMPFFACVDVPDRCLDVSWQADPQPLVDDDEDDDRTLFQRFDAYDAAAEWLDHLLAQIMNSAPDPTRETTAHDNGPYHTTE